METKIIIENKKEIEIELPNWMLVIKNALEERLRRKNDKKPR